MEELMKGLGLEIPQYSSKLFLSQVQIFIKNECSDSESEDETINERKEPRNGDSKIELSARNEDDREKQAQSNGGERKERHPLNGGAVKEEAKEEVDIHGDMILEAQSRDTIKRPLQDKVQDLAHNKKPR